MAKREKKIKVGWCKLILYLCPRGQFTRSKRMRVRFMGFVFAACERGQIYVIMTNKKLFLYSCLSKSLCSEVNLQKMAFQKVCS